MRDTLKNDSYWNSYFVTSEVSLRRVLSGITANLDIDSWLRRVSSISYELSWNAGALYSSGSQIKVVEDVFLRHFSLEQQLWPSAVKNKTKDDIYPGYCNLFAFLAQAVLFKDNIRDSDFFATVLDYFEEKDPICEAMLEYIGARKANPDVVELALPGLYTTLYEAMTLPAPQNAKMLKKFVKQWYNKMRGLGWHDLHKSKFDGYYGYWCYEAAAIAKICDIDDSELLDHPHYPADLIHRKTDLPPLLENQKHHYRIYFYDNDLIWNGISPVTRACGLSEPLLQQIEILILKLNEHLATAWDNWDASKNTPPHPSEDDRLAFKIMYDEVMPQLREELAKSGIIVYEIFPYIMR